MWIKKITTSLYISVLVRTILSVLVSLSLFFVLIICFEYYTEMYHANFVKQQQEEISTIAESIKSLIEEESLTYEQAVERNFDEGLIYEIKIRTVDEHALYERDQDINSSTQYIFDVSFSDLSGFIVIESEKIEFVSNVFYVFASVISIVLFLLLSLRLIFKLLSYIITIERGIERIANENIQYKIPIQGENELAKLAISINRMGDTLYEKIQKEREDEINQRMLITNMSHDLKTPLTCMNGYIDVAKRKLSKDHEIYPLITIAKENGVRLETLINDLFMYSKLISGDVPINIQNIDMRVMLKQILEFRTENIMYTDKEVELSANIDPEKFHRVIDNLISNAIKYGVENEPITVNVELKNEIIEIAIKNVTDENLDGKMGMLKNRLYTAHEDRANGSSGLGLSIVTELLRTMNGTLELSFNDRIFTATIKLIRE